MLKYRFEILYQTPRLKRASDFLRRMDLGMQKTAYKEVMTFTYTNEEKPISYFKNLIRIAMEESGFVLLEITGGKIE